MNQMSALGNPERVDMSLNKGTELKQTKQRHHSSDYIKLR